MIKDKRGLIRDKSGGSHSYLEIGKLKLPKSKRSEGIFGLSFGMIFAILLIITFVAAAMYGLYYFFSWQRTVQIGVFFQDLQRNIDDAYNAESASFTFTANVPSGIQYVCFVNMSSPVKQANDAEKAIYDNIKRAGYLVKDNFYIYSPDKEYGLKNTLIKHITLGEKNPICIKVKEGKVEIKIEKSNHRFCKNMILI